MLKNSAPVAESAAVNDMYLINLRNRKVQLPKLSD